MTQLLRVRRTSVRVSVWLSGAEMELSEIIDGERNCPEFSVVCDFWREMVRKTAIIDPVPDCIDARLAARSRTCRSVDDMADTEDRPRVWPGPRAGDSCGMGGIGGMGGRAVLVVKVLRSPRNPDIRRLPRFSWLAWVSVLCLVEDEGASAGAGALCDAEPRIARLLGPIVSFKSIASK